MGISIPINVTVQSPTNPINDTFLGVAQLYFASQNEGLPLSQQLGSSRNLYAVLGEGKTTVRMRAEARRALPQATLVAG